MACMRNREIQTSKQTHKRTLLKTIPPSLTLGCVGGRDDNLFQNKCLKEQVSFVLKQQNKTRFHKNSQIMVLLCCSTAVVC